MNAYRILATVCVLLTLVVVVAGAYVRLSDAGLGCPDWPGCYGKLTPAQAAPAIARTVAAQGGEHGPVSLAKAWKEMGHRYLAGALGLAIAVLAAYAWASGRAPIVATLALGVVVFQATLGMWTVTLLLRPAIVTAHLLGGMLTLALLALIALDAWRLTAAPQARALRAAAALGLAALAMQIALGGWVSANYAALACPDFPLCLGEALPPMDFGNAFHVQRELGMTRDGALLSREALTAIHWTHRAFAFVAAAAIGWAAWRACRTPDFAGLGALIAALLVLQIALGVGNVLASLPLWLAAAHNAGAALLLLALVTLSHCAARGVAPRHERRTRPRRAPSVTSGRPLA
jgi:cytochrome c oxidase assembly protein subunit 15